MSSVLPSNPFAASTPLASSRSPRNLELFSDEKLRKTDSEGKTWLMHEAFFGHYKNVAYLLSRKIEKDQRSHFGENALMLAISRGHTEVARLLIEKGCSLTERNDNGETILFYAVKTGIPEMVEFVFSKKPEARVADNDYITPLHIAAEQANGLEIVRFLLRNGANPAATNIDGETPLHRAIYSGSTDIIDLLCRQEHVRVDAKAVDDITPLHMAVEKGDQTITMKLLEMGADPLKKDAQGENALIKAIRCNFFNLVNLFLTHQAFANIEVLNSFFLIHIALAEKHIYLAKTLIDRGLNPLLPNADGWMLSHIAAMADCPFIYEFLRENGLFDPDADCRGTTPLHVAANFGNHVICRRLFIDYPECSLEKRNDHDLSALDIAVNKNFPEVVGLLIEKGCSLSNSFALLQSAMQHEKPNCFILLIQRLEGLNFIEVIYQPNRYGDTFFDLALLKGKIEIVEILLLYGAFSHSKAGRDPSFNPKTTLSHSDKKGWTALHYAAKKGHISVLRFLCDQLENYALYLNLHNNDGNSPLTEAICHNQQAAADFLKSRGAKVEIDNGTHLTTKKEILLAEWLAEHRRESSLLKHLMGNILFQHPQLRRYQELSQQEKFSRKDP